MSEDPGPAFLEREQVSLHNHKIGIALTEMLGGYSRETARYVIERDIIPDQLVHRLSAYVLRGEAVSGELSTTVQVPASWWQHFKQDCFPAWLLRWRPVRHADREVRVELSRFWCYPQCDLHLPPDRFGYPVMFEQARLLGPGVLNTGESRFASAHEIISQGSKDVDWQTGPGVPAYVVIRVFLDRLRAWGVNPDQLILHEALRRPHGGRQ